MDEIEQLGEVDESTDEQKELQSGGEMSIGRFLLAETLSNIRRCARGLVSVSTARGY